MMTAGSIYAWEFEKGARKMEVRTPGPLLYNEPGLMLEAALDGLGVAYLLEHEVAPCVQSGRLVRMLEDWTPPFPGFFLYYPSRHQISPVLSAFLYLARARGRKRARAGVSAIARWSPAYARRASFLDRYFDGRASADLAMLRQMAGSPGFVRRATADDLPLLPAVEAAADLRFAELGFQPLPPPGTVGSFAAARFVLVCDKPPVGFARVEDVDGLAHLEQLSVLPEHQGRGLGAILLEAAYREALRLEYKAMTLITFADVRWNGPFYARHGFRMLDVLSPGLAALRAKERALGLDAMGRRVVMKRPA